MSEQTPSKNTQDTPAAKGPVTASSPQSPGTAGVPTAPLATPASPTAQAAAAPKPAPKPATAPQDAAKAAAPKAAPTAAKTPTPTAAAPSGQAGSPAKEESTPSHQPVPADGPLPLLPQAARTSCSQLRQWAERLRHFCRPQGLPLRLLLACVLLPTLVVFLYLSIFASDIYLAEAKFAIRSQNQQQSLDMLSTFFRTSSSTLSDSYIVQNYIQSMDMINKVDAKLHLRDHYADHSHDVWYRLTQNPTQDEMLRYWGWAVVTTFDPDTSIMTVEVKAFSPQMARDACQAILDASEALVNAMNDRARTDAISLAQAEMARAEARIREAHEAMRQYRERTVILDPQAVASGLYGLVNQLEGEITKTTAELAEATTYMQADSPRVVMLQNRLAVLQQQLQSEKARLASQMQGDKPLSALVSEFQSLTLEEEFAQKQLTSAMASLEAARVQAESKTLYVESFQKPMVPDESLYPRPVVFSLIFMLAAAVLLGLVSLIVAAIREHAGF